MKEQIGFGGSCHWCTEAIFQSVRGVESVWQGWISALGKDATFSEAVIVNYDPEDIPLEKLIAIHLASHSCTSDHAMRSKYRSAVYIFSHHQESIAIDALKELQSGYDKPIITEVLHFHEFKLNDKEFLNYYHKDHTKPFCVNIVNPKLRALLAEFPGEMNGDKLAHLNP